MKALTKSLFLMMVLGLMFSCKGKIAGDAAKTGEAVGEAAKATMSATAYNVDATSSQINWTGSKVAGTHMGTINVKDGNLSVKDGNIEAGSFTIDMASIVNTDQEAGKGKEKLEGHLKSADFFDVATFPTATFTITNVSPVTGKEDVTHTVTGDLKMKSATKSITFDASVAIAGDKVSVVTPAFKINRTEWGVQYGSGIIGTAKDKAISDDIGLVISLDAAKS